MYDVRRLRAVLFDLDDTLANYRDAYARELEAVAAVVARRCPEADVAEVIARMQHYVDEHHTLVDTGKVSVDAFRRRRLDFALAPWRPGCAQLHRELSVCTRLTARSITLTNGAIDLLTALSGRGVRMAIVTNGPRAIQRTKCRRLGLIDRIPVVVTSADVGRAKPDPAIFTAACDQLHVRPAEAVVVGDSYDNDVVGGLAAGVGAAIHLAAGTSRSATTEPGPGLLGTAPSLEAVAALLGLGVPDPVTTADNREDAF